MRLFQKAKDFVRVRVAPREHRLLFAFTGSAGAWPGMGRSLYRDLPAFRESIEAAGALVEGLVGWSPAPFFRGDDEPPTTLELARRNNIIRLGILQIAQVDLWRDAGVRPAGVVSVSLGEMIAPYAAGALTREESVRVFTFIAEAASRTAGNERIFVIAADRIEAQRLARSSPAELHFLGLMAPRVAIVLCREADAEPIRPFLGKIVQREIPTDWNYHCPHLDLDHAWLHERLGDLRPRPPFCPIYSAAFGGTLTADTPLDAAFFAWMASHTYFFADAVSEALDDGLDTVVSIGSQPSNNRYIAETAAAAGRSVRIIDSMRAGNETRIWRRAVRAVRSMHFAPPRPRVARLQRLDRNDAELFDHYGQLRRDGSVHYVAAEHRWLLLGYDDVQRAFNDVQRFSSDVPELRRIDPVLLASDPPEHTAVRRMLAPLFTAEAVAHRAELIETTAAQLLQPLVEKRELEVVSELAGPLVCATAAELIGADDSAIATLRDTMAATGGDLETTYARMQRPVETFAAHTSLHPELRRGGLDDAAARSILRLLWIAATTPQHAISSAILLLLQHPDVRRRVQADRSLLGAFVDEALRLRPAAHSMPRRTTEDVEIGGATIPAGSLVHLMIAAANRDPARFEDPATLRLDRSSNPHLSFGGGVHRCIGALLGRTLITTALDTLFRIAPGFRERQPLATVRYVPGSTLREIERLVIAS